MKLLCVIPAYWPAFNIGGPVASVHSLNRTLVKKGIDVTVYTTYTGLDGKVLVNQEVNVDGVRVVYFDFIKKLEFLGKTGWQFSLSMTRALRDNLNTFDMVYINGIWNYTTAAAAFYCRKYKRPYVLAPRGTLYEYTMRKYSWKKWPYYTFIAKRDIRGASAIHFLTAYEKSRCHSSIKLSKNSIVIPNGIDLSEFEDLSTEGSLEERYPFLKHKKVILFLGRIHWIKGLDVLIKAMQIVIEKRKDVHLLVVGSGEVGYRNKIKKLTKDSGLDYIDYESGESSSESGVHVTFTGMLTGKEKLMAYAESDIFVLPSYSEGLSMAALEAMFCRLPVVISHQCNMPEVEREKAGVIVEIEPGPLHEALIDLIDNGNKAEEMGKRGQTLVAESFAIESVADIMTRAFSEVIDRSSNK